MERLRHLDLPAADPVARWPLAAAARRARQRCAQAGAARRARLRGRPQSVAGRRQGRQGARRARLAAAGPLALLKSIAGLDAGLDHGRDLLVVLLAAAEQFAAVSSGGVAAGERLRRAGAFARRRSAAADRGRDARRRRFAGRAARRLGRRDGHRSARSARAAARRQAPSPPPQLDRVVRRGSTANDAAVVVLPAGMRTAVGAAAERRAVRCDAGTAARRMRRTTICSGPRTGSRPRRATAGPPFDNWIRTTLRRHTRTGPLGRGSRRSAPAACGSTTKATCWWACGSRFRRTCIAAGELGNQSRTRRHDAATCTTAARFVVAGSGRCRRAGWCRPSRRTCGR